MATEIKFEVNYKSTTFGDLQVGDKFTMINGEAVYMKLPNLYTKSGDLYLKNAVNISSGTPTEIPNNNLITPVDLSITAYK